MTNIDDNLATQFKIAFQFPPFKRRLKTKRAQWYWINLSVLVDDLAGPLSAILNTGGCAYVYPREDRYFAGVTDPLALRAVWRRWHGELCGHVDVFEPASVNEAADLELMRRFASDILAVGERLLDIEQARFAAALDGRA